MTGREVQPGDVVRFGFRTGRVLRLERRHRQDGAIVQATSRTQGDGSLPHWVPLDELEVVATP